MTRYSKAISISFLWLSLIISSFFVVIWVKIVLLLVGIGVTIHISMLREVRKKPVVNNLSPDFNETD
jgi:hypothetical protein